MHVLTLMDWSNKKFLLSNYLVHLTGVNRMKEHEKTSILNYFAAESKDKRNRFFFYIECEPNDYKGLQITLENQ